MKTPSPRANYGITRIDQPEKKNHGFYVRVTHRGQTSQKYFPDKASGGKRRALKLAKEYRDGLLAKMPKSKQEQAARKKRKTLQSGVVGVTHVLSRVGDDREYEYWQAAWSDEHGKRRTAKFSIARHGQEKALDMAKKTRKKAVRAVAKLKSEAAKEA